MGGATAPQWLSSAFVRSARAVGAQAPDEQIRAVADRLIDRWREAGRFHHNLAHLIEVLQRVDTLAEETHNPDAVRIAAWYHGAIFDTSLIKEYRRAAGEDKVRSAALAAEELRELGVPDCTVDRITEMIRALQGHARAARDTDCQALSDADLGSLAVEPQRYRRYRENVRREFSHVSAADYLNARIAIVTRLLDRPHLFRSPMAGMWEDTARENLRAELARLTAERARLDRGEPRPATAASQPPPSTPHDSVIPHPSTLEVYDDEPAAPAEVVGLPVTAPTGPMLARRAGATFGIEREPSDLRSLPRRHARTTKVDRRGPFPAEEHIDRSDPKRPEADEDPTGTLFKPPTFD